MPRVNPLLASLTDFECDMIGCLAAGFTIADALRILGRDRTEEAVLGTDPRFRAVVRASAVHLAAIADSLSTDNSANVVPMTSSPQMGARRPPIAAMETQAVRAMSFRELLRLPSTRPSSDL